VTPSPGFTRFEKSRTPPHLNSLALDEFLRRFFLHVLPRGFVRIRHFGFFAHRRRAKLLPLCFAQLAATAESQPPSRHASAT